MELAPVTNIIVPVNRDIRHTISILNRVVSSESRKLCDQVLYHHGSSVSVLPAFDC
jgi:hypothetical protein